MFIDEQYGGLGLSQSGYCRVMEEFGYVDGTLAVVMGVHQSIGTKPLYLFGTDDQKARWLPDLAAGRKLAAFVLTEPNVGSDAYNLETWAERQSDGSWLLNGEKRWIGNGDKDVLTVFARSDLGHVALIVEKGMEGLTTGPALRHPRPARQPPAARAFQERARARREPARRAGRRLPHRDEHPQQRPDVDGHRDLGRHEALPRAGSRARRAPASSSTGT